MPSHTRKRPNLRTSHSKSCKISLNRSKRRFHSTNSAMSDGTRVELPIANLAVIDISPFLDAQTLKPIPASSLTTLNKQQQDTVDRMTATLNGQGFFFITGTPLQKLTPKLWSTSAQFFDLPNSLKFNSQAIDGRRGWHYFTSEHGDKIEAFSMQTPYLTDKQLGARYFGYSDDDGNNNTPSSGLPPGIFIDPKILAQFGDNSGAQTTSNSVLDSKQSTTKVAIVDTNKWPHQMKNGNEFRDIYKEYWNLSVDTAEATLTILALCLKINPQELLEWHSLQNHTLESKYYPAPSDTIRIPRGANLVDGRHHESANPDAIDSHNTEIRNNNASLDNVRIRFPIHSDMTSITLLTQSQFNGGLLIKTRSRGWERVGLPNHQDQNHDSSPNGSGLKTSDDYNDNSQDPILVNIGQFLAEFSGGSLDASLHCVVNSNDIASPGSGHAPSIQAKSRISTVFFCIPDHHAIIHDIRDPSRPYFTDQFHNLNLPPPDLEPFYPFEAGDRFPVVGM